MIGIVGFLKRMCQCMCRRRCLTSGLLLYVRLPLLYAWRQVTETSLGITSEELTELALAFDPSFFSGVTPGERLTLGTSVGSSSFTSYLYANGYTEVAKNLVAFEIKGTAPSPGGE